MAWRGRFLRWAWRVGEVGVEIEVVRTRRPCHLRRMAQEDWSLSEVRARVGASHGITDLTHKLHFYDQWAPDYDQVNWQVSSPLPTSFDQPQYLLSVQ